MLGQIGLGDRLRGAVDVVVDPVVGGLPRVRVELEPRGSRIAVARLADATGIDQPAALGEVEARAAPRLRSPRGIQ